MKDANPHNVSPSRRKNRAVPLAVQRSLREIGQDVATWRKLQRLTASQVADRAGVSRMTLYKLEHGDGSITFARALQLLRALGLLDLLTRSLDPYATDVGRLRSEEVLPQRVRS